MRRSEKRQEVQTFAAVDQQTSQEPVKEAAINHSTPGNGLTCASPKIQEVQRVSELAVPCSTWAAASALGRSEH